MNNSIKSIVALLGMSTAAATDATSRANSFIGSSRVEINGNIDTAAFFDGRNHDDDQGHTSAPVVPTRWPTYLPTPLTKAPATSIPTYSPTGGSQSTMRSPTLYPVKSTHSPTKSTRCLRANLRPHEVGLERYPNISGETFVSFNNLMDSVASMEMTGVSFPESIENVLLFRGGLDIHTGTSCDNAGGHFFRQDWSDQGRDEDGNPWFPIQTSICPNGAVYTTDTNGGAEGAFDYINGYGYEETIGKVVIVRDKLTTLNGDYLPIACGVLEVVECPDSVRVPTLTSPAAIDIKNTSPAPTPVMIETSTPSAAGDTYTSFPTGFWRRKKERNLRQVDREG